MLAYFRRHRRPHARSIVRGFALFWMVLAVAPCVQAAAFSGAMTAAPCHAQSMPDVDNDCDDCGPMGALKCETADQSLRVSPDTSPPAPAVAIQILERMEPVIARAELSREIRSTAPPPRGTPLNTRPHILRA
jgi:hypothetical protein